MALTKTWTCNKDARIAVSGSFEGGAGASSYMPVGLYSGYLYRALLGFTENWTGVSQIVSAKLRIRTSTQYYVAFGGDPDIYVERLTGSWSEGSSTGLSTGNAVTWANQPAGTTTNRATKDVSTSESTWIEITITDLIEDIAPTSVRKRDGSPGGNLTFTGLRLRSIDEGDTAETTEFYSSETSSDPEIVITYTDNEAPNAPTITSPTGGTIVTDTTPDLIFVHSDPDGDACSAYDIEVSTDSSFSSLTHWNIDGQTSGISGNTITRTYAGTALTRGVTYYWRARTKDPDGEWGAWSSTASFKVNQLPTATKVTPAASSLAFIHNLATSEAAWTAGGTDAQPRLDWSFSDADGDAQSKYRVRIYDASVGGSLVHDSGEVSSGTTQYDAAYGMPNGDQASSERWWTIEVWDSRGESSGESSRTGFRVLWGQAIYEYAVTGGTNSSSWAFTSGSVASNTQKAFLFRSATGASGAGAGAWQTSIGSVAPDAYLNVLVRLATYASGTNPNLPDMTFDYIGSAVFPDKWETQADNGAGFAGDWTLDVDRRRFGTRSLRCAVSSTSQDRFIWPADEVPVSAGTDYVLSAFVKTDGPLASGAYVELRVNYGDSFVEVPYTDTDEQQTDDSSAAPEGWQRLTLRFTTEAGVATVRPEVLYHHNGTTAGDVFWVDAVKLEEGNVATAWAPGAIGASILDSGGIAIDGFRGGIFRLRGTDGGARDMVELGAAGLVFGGDVTLYSDTTDVLATDDSLAVGADLSVAGDADVTGSLVVGAGITGLVPVIQTYVNAGSPHTWTKPAGLSHILVEVIGGGGGGGGTATCGSGESASAAGGGGGAYARKIFAADDLPASCTVTVGAAGSAASAGNNSGGTGGTSSFAGTGITTVQATGGTGGGGSANTTGNTRPSGGQGGTATGGDVLMQGGDGGGGSVVTGVPILTGRGSDGPFGGGARVVSAAAGSAGNAYGAGGSGATQGSTGSARAGGAGGAGLVIVTEFFGP